MIIHDHHHHRHHHHLLAIIMIRRNKDPSQLAAKYNNWPQVGLYLRRTHELMIFSEQEVGLETSKEFTDGFEPTNHIVHSSIMSLDP
jgi:hypothetical protein